MRRPYSRTATRRARRFKIRKEPGHQPGRLNGKLRLGEVPGEPVAGQLSHVLQRPGFLEQVRCAWDYYQLGLAAEAVHRLAVQFQHRGVLLADDQQDGLAYPGQNLTGQVRAATVRTIVARLEGGGFQLQLFLVISIISATRDILTVGAELSPVGGRFPVARTMTELAVNAGVVLALSVVWLW